MTSCCVTVDVTKSSMMSLVSSVNPVFHVKNLLHNHCDSYKRKLKYVI